MTGQVEKIRRRRAMGYTGLIQADGGVSLANLPLLKAAGLDVACLLYTSWTACSTSIKWTVS